MKIWIFGVMIYLYEMIRRLLGNKLTGLLKQFPAVVILGPRQVGKTTLAKQFAAVKRRKHFISTWKNLQTVTACWTPIPTLIASGKNV